MTGDERSRTGSELELPPPDLPSAEVLDELLRAFAADTADCGLLERIDLTSPEVEELLSAPPAAEPQPQHEVEVEGPADEASIEGEQPAEVGDDEHGPAGDDEPGDVDDQDGYQQEREPEQTEQAEKPEQDDHGEPAEVVGEPEESASTSRTIRIDASDDPPDAVYLAAGDPLLAKAAGARAGVANVASVATGTVFIDDQDSGRSETVPLADATRVTTATGATSATSATSATRIEPRLRVRRIAVKRAVGRKRLRWVLVGVAILVVLIAGLAVLGSSLFEIEHVDVEGAVYTDPAALQAVVDELEGTPVLRADTGRAEQALEAIPWVEDARVTTGFPHSATIELRERTPAATFQGPDGRYRVIDNHGRVLDVLDGQPTDYLLLVAADATDLDAGQFAPQGYAAAGSLAAALTPEIRALAESAAVSADGSDLRLMLTGGVEVRFGPARDLVTKLVRLQTRLDQVAGGGYRYLDVSTNEVTTG